MEAFYVCIIFLGVLLVIASIFLIIMDRVNGKDFFKEFDRKKDEMFNLIQDSEDMVQELNKMSDYVITAITEKNQEFFDKKAKDSLQQVNHDNMKEVSEDKSQPEGKPCEIRQDPVPENNNVQNVVQDKPDVTNVEQTTSYPEQEIVSEKAIDSNDTGKSRLVLNGRRKEVLSLIEQGLTNDEISDKLKIGKGEIALIRGLSR
jgi:ATP/maltotriose-dependent transcriptional regulator MalT